VPSGKERINLLRGCDMVAVDGLAAGVVLEVLSLDYNLPVGDDVPKL
jgi:hypothetical protein